MGLVKRTYVDGETVITADNLNDIQDEIIQNASDISTKGTYSKPSGGIPASDLASGVQTSLGKADTAYQKPSGGIPSTDLASAVQTSLGKADTALQSSDIDNTLTVTGKAADAKKTGDEISGIKNTLNHKADAIYDTASGDIASFPDGADGLPVKDLTVGIEPVQDLHGYDSPWPAGGGKNLLPMTVSAIKSNNTDGTWSGNAYTLNGITFTLLTDSDENITGIQVGGTATANTTFNVSRTGFSESDSQRYTVSGGVAGGGQSTYRLYFEYLQNSVWQAAVLDSTSEFVKDCNGFRNIRITVGNGTTVSNIVFYPMIRLDTETDPTFAPYSNICPISGWTGCNISHSGADTSDPTIIPISWQTEAGTVYGGTLDVTSGVLTVTMVGINLGNLTWTYESNPGNLRFWATPPHSLKIPTDIYTLPNAICEIYKPENYYNIFYNKTDQAFSINNSGNINIYDSSYTDKDTFKTAMSGVLLVAELATPLVYNLSSVTVTTLYGENNFWSDTGSSTVEYPCDTKLYIQKINTPTDDDMIADANIASGQYFIVNNNLYLSTTAILAGDPIKPGTNCTLTNLAAALNAINS